MNTLTITTTQLVNPMTYQDFKALSEELVAQNKTSGEEQSEQRIGFTKLNQQRMKRVEKQFVLQPELKELLEQNQQTWKWMIMVESWCGDGAQLLPAIAAIAEEAPNVELTVLLRDENPALMETCLTNGSRAIPKLLCIDAETEERVFTWGPRPAAIQEQVKQLKAEKPDVSHDELVQQIQLWYAKDRSQSLQQDLVQVLQEVLSLEV
ncbi:thioredoxin family protein [Pontibacter anaerobius]|uniref:Thioredoxin family protein n=1 Tax=Pontibacter anaerobius TaxID=2993940 RepID=A0ABT3RDC3_9BACT|nr:thioredoxin family protein [Pontibacter anaerobius]MCX2739545.1 thioredoxin family protein [Pontibacter anaerobius]